MTRQFLGTEKEILGEVLDQQREVVLWKVEGLNDDELRQRPLPVGKMYLLGLVKHLAGVEQYYFCHIFGRPAEPFSLAASDDLEVEDGDTTEGILAYYSRACAASDRAIAELDLDATATTWLGDTVSLRWAILHVLEETTRHIGHVDLIREHIDGTTGYLRGDLPY